MKAICPASHSKRKPSGEKELEIELEHIEAPVYSKVELEQYRTPPYIAARLVYFAWRMGDIEKKTVADLGCGTGILGIASAMMGASKIICVDIDRSMLALAMKNARRMRVICCMEFIQADLREKLGIEADTVVQNPPFGVRRRGADVLFLRRAVETARVVYSIHKRATRKFILRKIEEIGGRVTHLIEAVMPIPPTMDFHRELRHEVNVDMIRIEVVK
ncbi:MAG: hypothetical protein DRN96_02320 [Thermoproteota archaeon]|nr:MAG: hypothetical protein DRN96_02320 [Candidatus Korarchaeota archaeon]RLG55894.1 MAG: hypothetical protein DRN99_01260 [Candidatus Korarchaeota archaeon]